MTTSIADVRRALARHALAEPLPDASRRAGVALILREGAGGLDALFIQRAEHPDDPWSGQMGLPGGRSEPDDRDIAHTAERETREEIGIDLARDGERLGPLDEFQARHRGGLVDLSVAPTVYHLIRDREPTLNHEVQAVHWFGVDALRSDSHRRTFDLRRGDLRLKLPCFRIEGKVIWGMTYRIFENFEDVLACAR